MEKVWEIPAFQLNLFSSNEFFLFSTFSLCMKFCRMCRRNRQRGVLYRIVVEMGKRMFRAVLSE